MKNMGAREKRAESINLIINEISKRGRNFFLNKETRLTSYFHFKGNMRKRLWYWDKRGGDVNPYPSKYQRDWHFSDGGTLWGLIHDFSEFILTGKNTNGVHGYGGLYCEHWGYSEDDMVAIRKIAVRVGFLQG